MNHHIYDKNSEKQAKTKLIHDLLIKTSVVLRFKYNINGTINISSNNHNLIIG